MVPSCRLCDAELTPNRLDLGRLPICNRFAPVAAVVERYELAMTQCAVCAFIQLCTAPPVAAIVPRFPWIRYSEPESHLNDVVDRILGHLPNAQTAMGVGPFEKPFLDRFGKKGLKAAPLKLDLGGDGSVARFPYLETWQDRLTTGQLQSGLGNVAKNDIVSCRYIIEHCHDPKQALRRLGELLSEGGIMVVEVPDSTKFLAARDYGFPWEEHVSYFVEDTFRQLAEAAGFSVVEMLRYSGRLEDALIALLRPVRPGEGGGKAKESVQHHFQRYEKFSADFVQARISTQSRFRELAGPSRNRLALFGVGHQAIMFVNTLELEDYIGAVIDDQPEKQGLVPPGFKVAITNSASLMDNTCIGTCLLAINPLSESKVREKLAPLARRGVELHSIYAGVPGSILSGMAPWH